MMRGIFQNGKFRAFFCSEFYLYFWLPIKNLKNKYIWEKLDRTSVLI